jgi:hypothetical protein
MVAETTINAGVCGFTTTVTADSPDTQNVTFTVVSDCDEIKALGQKLAPVDAYMEIGGGHDGELLKTVRANIGGCCAGCAVPAGIFKTMQVAAGLALPRDIHMSMSKR